MKTIQQQANCEITIARVDTNESVTFSQGTTMELDDATADALLAMRQYDRLTGGLVSDFKEV